MPENVSSPPRDNQSSAPAAITPSIAGAAKSSSPGGSEA
jgi:hypothetical protein